MDQSQEACVPPSAEEIEIPEPDYDDDDDDCDVTEGTPGTDVTDNVAETLDGCHGDEQQDDGPVLNCDAVCDELERKEDDGDTKAFSFDEVRAKLEAFTRDELRVLAASIASDMSGFEIPDPDYSDSDEEHAVDKNTEHVAISPRKVDNQSVAASKEQKELLRELLRNQKLGINVLAKKSELDRELDKRKQRQQKREEEEMQQKNRSIFDQRMEQQANKLITHQTELKDDSENQSELVKVYTKISKLKSACS